MDELKSIFLGLLQGIAEFLPISSSGHLSICQNLFGMTEGNLTLNIALHAATLLVILIFFRKKILSILYPFDKKYILAIIITTIPTGIIGLGFKKLIPDLLTNENLSAGLLVCNGLYLIFISRLFFSKNESESDEFEVPNPLQALVIGMVQGLAVLPGLSRSGLTIGVSKLLGMKSTSAVEYSLIASLPAITGAVILESREMTNLENPVSVLLGVAAACLSGWFAVKILLRIVKSNAFKYWGFYCLLAGVVFFIIKYV